MWRWLIPLSVVPVLGLLAYGFRVNPRDIPSPLVGRPAAPFVLRTFDGRDVSLESLRGRVVVLNFWASWCYPACYEEAPALERSWRAYRGREVSVDYGVYGVPETFFIDRAGRIRRKQTGAVSDDLFRREVEKLLGEPA